MGFDLREWALNWLRGSITSYMRGKIGSAMLFGRVKRCIESYGVTPAEVKALIDVIIMDPTLNLGSPEERREKLNPLLRFLDEELGGTQ